MQVTVQVPDELSQQFGNPASLPRQFLEAFAVEEYRARRLSRAQVGRLLGLDYWGTERFLGEREAKRPVTLAELESDREALKKVLGEP